VDARAAPIFVCCPAVHRSMLCGRQVSDLLPRCANFSTSHRAHCRNPTRECQQRLPHGRWSLHHTQRLSNSAWHAVWLPEPRWNVSGHHSMITASIELRQWVGIGIAFCVGCVMTLAIVSVFVAREPSQPLNALSLPLISECLSNSSVLTGDSKPSVALIRSNIRPRLTQ
jgi:hypothetical protein